MTYLTVNVLCCLLIITSLMVVLTKAPKSAAYCYAIQSLVLVTIFISLGVLTGSTELFTWSATAFLTKVVFVPAVVIYTFKKMGSPTENIEPVVRPMVSIILAIIEVAICFAIIQYVEMPGSAEIKPALAVSLAHFFIGLTCIVSQRNILKQMFGYCLMENGSHLTLALLAPTAPEIVEIGIATDAIFAVVIMAIIVYRVYRKFDSMNSDELMELKG